MNAIWTPSPSEKRRRRLRRYLLLLVVFALVTGLGRQFYQAYLDSTAVQSEQFPVATETVESGATESSIVEEPSVPDNIITHQIKAGDNLSAIFDSIPVSQPILHQILAADEELLVLDVLHPGNSLTFTLDDTTRALVQMELYIHPGRQVVYRKVGESTFEFEEIVNPGTWEQQLINGEITGNFYLSAQRAGLSEQETANIADLFKGKINFARDMRMGDRFQVIRKQQFVNGESTGERYIDGVRIFNQNQIYTAFLFEDGNYYDQRGESLASAFRRYPFKGNYRISSPFNPARLNPITGRISPHNGTDFAMPTGTPILSTGDGIINRVKSHPYAGKYIEVRHSGQYVTRYLHLYRTLVKEGQKVKRGERIALSGNTGRSTGPHLHFELHIKSRPVNPVSAKIPVAASIPKRKRQEFNDRITALVALMEHPQQIAKFGTVSQTAL